MYPLYPSLLCASSTNILQPLQEREAEYEAEQIRIKKEKELEIARLRARQQKARDYQAEKVRK